VIPDVGEVELCGGREPRLLVTLDARRLSAYRLPIPAVVQALARSLGDEPGVPAGLLAVTATRSMEALTAVRVRPGEPAVMLRDVASITVDGATPVCDAARIGGGLAVVGLVRARHDADLQAMTAAVRAELAARRSEVMAQGVTLDVFAASPLRFMLDLPAHADPAEAKIAASRSIAEELTAIGPGYAARLAFLRVTTAPRIDFDAELILESTGLEAVDIAALEQRLSSTMAVRGQLYEPSSLRFWITGEEIAANRQIAEKAAELVTGMSGVVYATARDPLAPGHVLAIKRERLAELGLSVAELGVTLAAAIDGASAGSVELDGARLPVIVRVGPSTPASAAIEALEQLEVLLPAGGKVRLTELVDIKRELEPVTISRVDGRRATRVDVTVSVAESMSERIALLQRELAASLELPVGHTLVWD
jgi:multidrug efflux pump subunit AcrB